MRDTNENNGDGNDDGLQNLSTQSRRKQTKSAKNKTESKEEKRLEEEFRKRFLDIELTLPFPSIKDQFPPWRYIQPENQKVICNPEKKKDVPPKEATSCEKQTKGKRNSVDLINSRCLSRWNVVDWNTKMHRAEEFKRIFLGIETPLPTSSKIDKSPTCCDNQSGYVNMVCNPNKKTIIKKNVPLKEEKKESTITSDIIEGKYQKRLAEEFEKLVSEDEEHVSPVASSYKRYVPALPPSYKRKASLESAGKSWNLWLLINPTPMEEETWMKTLRIEPPMTVPIYDTDLPGFWNSCTEKNGEPRKP